MIEENIVLSSAEPEILKRPTKIRRNFDIQIIPDLEFTDIDGTVKRTFKCWRFKNSFSENCWKIEMIKETPNEITFVRTDENGDVSDHVVDCPFIQKLYPYGCDGYNFNPNDIFLYTWKYKF